MAKYMTPDFDVTVYEIEDRITAITDSDPDEGEFNNPMSWGGLEGGDF